MHGDRDFGLSRKRFVAGSAGAATVALLGAAPSPNPGGETLAFTGGRILDGNGDAPIEAGVLLVRAGRVVAVGAARSVALPESARRIDVAGKSIVPALIDAHTHVGIVRGTTASADNYAPETIEANLETFRRFGIAAVLVMGTERIEVGAAERESQARTPQATGMETAGSGFGVVDGYPPAAMIGAPWISRPTTPAEARELVRTLAAASPDIVKLWVDSGFGKYPTMAREISAAIIDEAHNHGLRAAAHLFYLDDAKLLVRQGLDVIAHSVRDTQIDDAFLEELRDRNVAYITTLSLDESQYVYADDPPPAYTNEPAFRAALEPGVGEKLSSQDYKQKKRDDSATPKWRAAAQVSKANALRALRAGVTVALGTDSGATFERIRGFDTHRELELYVQSGFTPLEALRCGTVNAARVLGERAADYGALAPGKRANFMILDGNPAADITATRRGGEVWLGGARVPSWQDAHP
jgi:imidazolonepropionase-like amidohydrolase